MQAYMAFMLLHSYGPLEVYPYFSRLLWCCQRNVILCKEILDLGLTRFSDNEQYLLEYSSAVTDMGMLDGEPQLLLLFVFFVVRGDIECVILRGIPNRAVILLNPV